MPDRQHSELSLQDDETVFNKRDYSINLLKHTGYVTHQQFNIQQL